MNVHKIWWHGGVASGPGRTLLLGSADRTETLKDDGGVGSQSQTRQSKATFLACKTSFAAAQDSGQDSGGMQFKWGLWL